MNQFRVSNEAKHLRMLAATSNAYAICFRYFRKGKVIIPYKSSMCDVPMEEILLSVRATNGLKRAGAHTMGKLKAVLEQENGLRNIRNLGVKSEREIKIGFLNYCYSLLSEQEQTAWWQEVMDRNCVSVLDAESGMI